MSNASWKFWIVPLFLWAIYGSWHIGYQSGYADGHLTATRIYERGAYVAPIVLFDPQHDQKDQLDTDRQ
jgi:hypothetical protein